MKYRLLLFMSFAMFACDNVEPAGESAGVEKGSSWESVSVAVDILGTSESFGTRSILSGDIENKITGITLAAYDEQDVLVDVKHYESRFSSMSLNMRKDMRYTVYALANMGNMTSAFPAVKSGVDSIEYVVPSYKDVNVKGIPMCGIKEFGIDEKDTVVWVERLFAKVEVTILHSGLEDASEESPWVANLCNKSLYVRQANSRLLPFAEKGSRAESPADIMKLSDHHSDLNDVYSYDGRFEMSELCPGPGYFQDTTIVFYVPENVQGRLLPQNSDPFSKVHENLEGVNGKSYGDICTYLEFNAFKADSQGYSGSLMYKYYLGEDNTSDFSIERNCHYVMTLDFSEKGFFMDNWKITRGDDWVDTRSLHFLADSYNVTSIRPVDVMIHYHPHNAGGNSMPDPDKWTYSYDKEAAGKAGLILTFRPDSLVNGNFFLRAETMQYPKVGASIPIKIMTTDGVVSDSTVVTIGHPMYMYIEWVSQPRFLSQYGNFKITRFDEDDFPLTMVVGDTSRIYCEQVARDEFKVTVRKTGVATVTITNALGTKTRSTFVDGLVPHFALDTTRVELSLSGKVTSVGFELQNKSDYSITNIDADVFDEVIALVPDDAPDWVDLKSYVHRLDFRISDSSGLKVGDTYTFDVGLKTYPWYNPKTITAVIVE